MKKIGHFIWLLILFNISVFVVSAEEFTTSSNHVILYNMNDGSVLYEKNSEEKTAIASLTKIMTAIVVIENNDNLNELVTIKNKMLGGLAGYSIVGLKAGDVLTIRDLLYGTLLPSGADAVQALAIHTCGTVNEFVKLMNQKAKDLGLENTSFENPIGMDHEDNYSTAKDVARLLQYALKNSDFNAIFSSRDYRIIGLGLSLRSTLYGYAYGMDISNITGSKSGFTYDAGYCLASTASIDGVNYLLINIGSDISKKSNAVKDTLTVYNYYSSNYSYQVVADKDKKIIGLPVKLGKDKTYAVSSLEDIKVYLKNDINLDKLEFKYSGIDKVTSKINKGEKIGNIKVLLDNEEITNFDVFLEDELEYHNVIIYGSLIAGVLVIITLLVKRKFK